MKKKELINLIKAYTYRNDTLFKKVCYEIADEFYSSNNKDLADYIISLISNDYFLPQNDDISSNFEEENNHNIINKPFFSSNKGSLLNDDEFLGNYLTKYSYNEKEPLFLPSDIKDDYIGVINAIKRNNGINKFLFVGESGTGKTASVLFLGNLVSKDVYVVNFESLIDSKLGESLKNLSLLFDRLNNLSKEIKEKTIILFDEIDILVLNRISSQDVREMGRLTSLFLRKLDEFSSSLVLIATTNLEKNLDDALKRRFDATINFNHYSKEDLYSIAEEFLKRELTKNNIKDVDTSFLRKIFSLNLENKKRLITLTPGKLKNIIHTSIGFSSSLESKDYFRRIYNFVKNNDELSFKNSEEEIAFLTKNNFSYREIEILISISKSKISRLKKEGLLNEK